LNQGPRLKDSLLSLKRGVKASVFSPEHSELVNISMISKIKRTDDELFELKNDGKLISLIGKLSLRLLLVSSHGPSNNLEEPVSVQPI
jgi:hypothetical protein